MTSQQYLPEGVPTVFRGGRSLVAKEHEVKTDKITGLIKTTHGISVDSEASEMEKFGGAYQLLSIPRELNVIQRGRRESHFEIVPASPMPFDEYQELLNEIELQPFVEEHQL